MLKDTSGAQHYTLIDSGSHSMGRTCMIHPLLLVMLNTSGALKYFSNIKDW